ncbi:DUF6794 domain-containing protein [Pedobacter sp. P351]|uniref:DUF6794 domain-containing protein n=1 Tax=Pedobacter superstes TaxID=3133441 RepID=UPI0030A6FE7F
MFIPANLPEAIESMIARVTPEDQVEIMEMSEVEFLKGCRFGGGLSISNEFGLWSGESGLAKWFSEKGIEQADDMNAIVLTSFYRTITNNPIDLDAQVKDVI